MKNKLIIFTAAFPLLLIMGCSKATEVSGGSSAGATGPDLTPVNTVIATPTVTAYATAVALPQSGPSTDLTTQIDTLCVNFTGVDLIQLRADLDALSLQIKSSHKNWYNQYKLNDQDYVAHCSPGIYPKTFVSLRTGTSHTVNNLVACRAATSDLVSTEYVAYINGGGDAVTMPAKIKTSGCTGGVAPFVGRLQSVHGSMMSDFNSIP